MNSNLIHLIEFIAFCSALMLIAFRPAWREWQFPSDCEPLPISPDYSIDIDYFATSFYSKVENFLTKESVSGNQQDFQFISASASKPDWSDITLPVIVMNSMYLKEVMHCQFPVFVNGDFHTIGADNLKSIYTQGKISLGPYSRIDDWAYARETIILGYESSAPRRLSSATCIYLEHGCHFERVNAPVISFGLRVQNYTVQSNALIESSFSELKGAVQQSSSLTLIRGDCEIPNDRVYRGSLIVTGRLIVGDRSRIIGDVKARKNIVVGVNALIGGALICEKNITLKEYVCVKGPIISEVLITIGAHSTVGIHELPTTVSAERIIVGPGVIAHGTVWARERGVTCPS
jgi:predicted acyltransferase (DUF342 family)